MSKRVRNILTYIVFLGIGLTLLWLVYRKVDFEEMMGLMSETKPWAIILSAVMGYLAIVSRGLRWIIAIEPLGYKPRVWGSIHTVAFAYFANTFIPRSGEIARCAALNQTDDIPADKLFGTVVTERVIDFVMFFIFIAVAMIGNSGQFMKFIENASLSEDTINLVKIGLAVMALGIVLLILLRKQIAKLKIYRKIEPILMGILDGLKSVFAMKKKWGFLLHTLFIWLMYYGMAWIFFKGIPGLEDVPIMSILIIMIAGGLGMIFPAPGGTGSYQYAVVTAFTAMGIGNQLGEFYAGIVWFTQTAMIVLSGAIGYIWITRQRIKKSNKA